MVENKKYIRTEGLVSIISPCYNGALYIHRLLDSVLSQNYEHIEFIIVDDGSIDNSKDVIESYTTKYSGRGYSLSYMYQQNSGQAAAVDKALKHVTGEFLIWPDSDDYFSSPESISTFVDRFDELDECYGVVRSYVNLVSEDDGKLLSVRKPYIEKEKLFEEFFTGKESVAVAGSYMVRMTAFDFANPRRSIYTIDHPQNWQLLLPVLYHFKCLTIKEPLHNIVVRTNSHSTNNKPYTEHIKGFEGYSRIINHTIDDIDMPDNEKERYKYIYKRYNLYEKLTYAINYYQKEDSRKYAKELSTCGGYVSNAKKFKIVLLSIHPYLLRIFNILRRS